MTKHKRTMRSANSHSKSGSSPSLRSRRDHKDTLFRMLFSTRENLLSLYNAVNGTHYTDVAALKIVTLENAIYMNMKNDQAFLLDFHLNLYEHQSSWNPNMPLRFLLYVAREYQMLIRNQTIYSSSLVTVPTPHIIVFYNGEDSKEPETTLKLSNAFQQSTTHPELELLVRVLNINLDKNPEILNACQTLKEYMLLVERIRTYAKDMPLNAAVTTAVNECIEENILADFLRKNKAEAIEMCLFEYDEKREKELIRKAEFQEGVKDATKRMIQALQLIQKNCSPNEIEQETGLSPETVEKMLETLHVNS